MVLTTNAETQMVRKLFGAIQLIQVQDGSIVIHFLNHLVQLSEHLLFFAAVAVDAVSR